MSKGKFGKAGNRAISAVKSFVSDFKVQIIISFLVFVIGVVLGMIIIASNGASIEIDHFFNVNIVLVLTNSRNFFIVFIWNAIYFITSVVIILIFSKKKWMIVINLIVVFINGYIIGYDFAIMIVIFGFAGFINGLLFVFLFDMLVGICLVLISAMAMKKAIIEDKYGCDYFYSTCTFNYRQTIVAIMIVALTLLFIQSLLMPIMRVTIFVPE